MLVDKCGLNRVKTIVVLGDEKPEDKPFVFPKDVTQVFYVDDPLNSGWKFIVPVDPRLNLIVYKHPGERGALPGEEATSKNDGRGDGTEDTNTMESAEQTIRGGELVAVEADDDAGEGENNGDDSPHLSYHPEGDSDGYSKDEDDAGKWP